MNNNIKNLTNCKKIITSRVYRLRLFFLIKYVLLENLFFKIINFFLYQYYIKMVNCEQRVVCNPPNVKCWKTEVRVAACGISSTDFPYLDSGLNQSSSLVLSAYPNTEGPSKKGCLVLNDDCCNTIQTLGTWASLSIPKCLVIDLTINLNNGASYDFSTTTGLHTVTPCNVACYDKSTPVWLAPIGAQPAPCIKATLLQTISQCNKTICWTVSLDCTNDSEGAAVIDSIVDVGCTALASDDKSCSCQEKFNAYDVNPSAEEDGSFNQTFTACGYFSTANSNDPNPVPSLGSNECIDPYTGNNTLTLTKGTIIEGEFVTDTFTEAYLRTLTTQVGLYNCQVFNFWAAVYANPKCINLPDQPPTDSLDTDPLQGLSGPNPNNNTVLWSPLLQKATCGRNYLWVVKYADGAYHGKGDGNLRFELNKTSENGNYTRATTRELFQDMRKWQSQLSSFSTGGFGITSVTPIASFDCKVFYNNANQLINTSDTIAFTSGYINANSPQITTLDTALDTEISSSVRALMYGSTFFVGIGDRCAPYSVFKTPRTGNDYQSSLIPWSPAGLITQEKSSWFGMMFGSNQTVSSSCPEPPIPEISPNCIC